MDSDRGRELTPSGTGAGKAILAGSGIAMAGAVVCGLVAYQVRYEFSLLAVGIGVAVGVAMTRLRPAGRSLAIAGALISEAGCAVGS